MSKCRGVLHQGGRETDKSNIVVQEGRPPAGHFATNDHSGTEQPPPAYPKATFRAGWLLTTLCADDEMGPHFHELRSTQKHHRFDKWSWLKTLTSQTEAAFSNGYQENIPLSLVCMSVFCARLVQTLLSHDKCSITTDNYIALHFSRRLHKSYNGPEIVSDCCAPSVASQLNIN